MYSATSSGFASVEQYGLCLGSPLEPIRPQVPAIIPAIPAILPTLAAMVAAKHGITVEDLRGQRRKRKIAWARQEFAWRAYQVRRPDGSRRFSTTYIANFCDGRDHTTAVHSIRRFAERRRVWLVALAQVGIG